MSILTINNLAKQLSTFLTIDMQCMGENQGGTATSSRGELTDEGPCN